MDFKLSTLLNLYSIVLNFQYFLNFQYLSKDNGKEKMGKKNGENSYRKRLPELKVPRVTKRSRNSPSFK